MNVLLERLIQFRQRTRRVSTSSRVAIVHWDQDTLDFLIVSPKSETVAPGDHGRLSWAAFDNPLQALSEHWSGQADAPKRLITLLSRPLLEQLSLTLPPSDASELPALVAAEVEQRLGEGDAPPIVDFYAQPNSQSPTEPSGQQVLAFALAAQDLERIQEWSQQAGLRLSAVCSRELSPLGILRRKHVAADSLNISVHLVSGEAELAVCHGAEPIYLRLIRVAVEEPQRVAEQVWMETQRCLTILPAELAELPQAWFVFTSCDAAWHVARSLEDRGVAVQPVDPLFGWQAEPPTAPTLTDAGASSTSSEQIPSDESIADDPSELTASIAPPILSVQTSAANAGAAWEFLHGELSIDLLNPKKAPVAPNPLRRWGALAAAVVALAGLGVYFLLADIGKLQAEVAGLKTDVASEKQLTAKFQEKADQVSYIETWLSDQVDWLSELNELSGRLPTGEQATVRRLTASAAGKTASVDIAVQVAQQENIAQLENRIRSAKYQATSQRISQNADSSEYPWQFETHVTFPVEPPQRDAYVAGESTTPPAAKDQAATPTNTPPQATAEQVGPALSTSSPAKQESP